MGLALRRLLKRFKSIMIHGGKDLLHGGQVSDTHIVPESTFYSIKGAGSELKVRFIMVTGYDFQSITEQADCAASVLAVLKCFGYDIDNLNGSKVHSLYNVMTMEADMREFFDRLEI